ncbi:hypothetical protein CC77DRAFT_80188 [Alternaria alternata]|uniref:Uncharacterized protein n=1 Tax=Alternaria alternata TaxID=5599 RepID=A0A177DLF9_ALTAL|nr:hypothetical protein CC77DRAFT_80188 [Alternaria alternata]OAG20774.1 hypothetical protein CC77DRAFT_80188 [Alternaria alternata]
MASTSFYYDRFLYKFFSLRIDPLPLLKLVLSFVSSNLLLALISASSLRMRYLCFINTCVRICFFLWYLSRRCCKLCSRQTCPMSGSCSTYARAAVAFDAVLNMDPMFGCYATPCSTITRGN